MVFVSRGLGGELTLPPSSWCLSQEVEVSGLRH